MAIMCDICQAFADMSAHSILDHCLGCKAKHDKEHAEHEGPSKNPKKKKSQSQRRCLSHMVQMLPRSHKEQNATHAFHLVKLVKIVSSLTESFWIIPDLP